MHQRVAVSGPQRPLVSCRRGEVPSLDVDRGVCPAEGRVSPARQRMVELCLLCDRAECLHGRGLQVQVAVITGDDELGVAGTRRRVLQDSVPGQRPVRLVQ